MKTAAMIAEKPKQRGHDGRPGEAHHFARITGPQVLEMRRRRARGEKIISIAKDYPISARHVGDIVGGRAWKHIS